MMIFRNSIRNGTEFYYQWRKSHLMTSWKDCTNKEYESLRNSRPYWNWTTWRFIRRKPDLIITDWRRWRKRGIEQNLRFVNFETRNRNYERSAMVKNQETKHHEQRTPGDCWQWTANGQCSKGDTCSFRHDINKRAKMTQLNPSPSSFMQQNEKCVENTEVPEERVPVVECLDGLARVTSKGTCTSSFCEKWHRPECLFYKSENGCRFGDKCSYAHRQVEEQPGKKSEKNGDKSAVAMLKSTRQ